MKFNPEATLSKRFEEGVYFVSIDDIQRKPTSTGIEKWDITVKDDKGNTGRVAFFDNGDDINPDRGMSDNDWFLQKMLKSIQDAGFTIPDADYNFDNVDRFLASKQFKAYVRFVPQKNNPEYTNGYFTNKFAYDKTHEGEEKQSSSAKNDNPFAVSGNTEIDIKDEDIPF